MVAPLVAGLGPQEVIIIALLIVLLFGAKKLPELARGSGRALRIFKAETRGLHDDDDDLDSSAYDDSPAARMRELRRQADERPRETRREPRPEPILDAEIDDRRDARPEYRSER